APDHLRIVERRRFYAARMEAHRLVHAFFEEGIDELQMLRGGRDVVDATHHEGVSAHRAADRQYQQRKQDDLDGGRATGLLHGERKWREVRSSLATLPAPVC